MLPFIPVGSKGQHRKRLWGGMVTSSHNGYGMGWIFTRAVDDVDKIDEADTDDVDNNKQYLII